jgi:hypothetical protein
MEDEVEKALSRPCLYTSEEKLDTGLSMRVVSGIGDVVRGTDTRYVSQKPMSVGRKLWHVGLVWDVGKRYGSVFDVGTRDGISVVGWYEITYKCQMSI